MLSQPAADSIFLACFSILNAHPSTHPRYQFTRFTRFLSHYICLGACCHGYHVLYFSKTVS